MNVVNAVPTPRWTVRAPGNGTAKTTLYCFPHGGGSAAEYVRWARDLRRVAVCSIQLPGRGSRLAEPPHTTMTELVRALLAGVTFTKPYIFFGHSFGALLAYELAHALRAEGRALPERLVMSSYPAPHLPRQVDRVHDLPDRELLGEIARRHGGIPEEVLADAELSRIAAACARADYRIVETYVWQPRPPLPVPVTVLGGQDDVVSQEQLAAWSAHTSKGPVQLRTFPGGHFYFRERPRAAVLRAVEGAAC